MVKRRGFVSPARAAGMLGVHRNTVYGWARDSAAGNASRLSGVERHAVTGYLSIPLEEVKKLKGGGDDEG